MKHLVLIALGGAGGALARHWMTALVQNTAAGQFPWGTLSVNLLGSLGIGVAYVLIMERALLHPDWRGAVMVGFLGAFTTFSAFSLETPGVAGKRSRGAGAGLHARQRDDLPVGGVAGGWTDEIALRTVVALCWI